jgi:hypothetical protein
VVNILRLKPTHALFYVLHGRFVSLFGHDAALWSDSRYLRWALDVVFGGEAVEISVGNLCLFGLLFTFYGAVARSKESLMRRFCIND